MAYRGRVGVYMGNTVFIADNIEITEPTSICIGNGEIIPWTEYIEQKAKREEKENEETAD